MNNITIIEQKMSGTGTIHDLASQHSDRQIDFGENGQYAIVLAAYYGNGDLYYVANSKDEALALHEQHKEWSHGILNRNGDMVTVESLYW